MQVVHRSNLDADRQLVSSGRESADVALLERIEALEAERTTLRREREQLKTDLVVAQAWVEELAKWLEVDEPPRREARDVRALHRMLAAAGVSPIPRRTFAVVSSAILVPWVVVVLVAHLAWTAL